MYVLFFHVVYYCKMDLMIYNFFLFLLYYNLHSPSFVYVFSIVHHHLQFLFLIIFVLHFIL